MAGHGNLIGKVSDLLDVVGIGVDGMEHVRYKCVNEQKRVGSNCDDRLGTPRDSDAESSRDPL